MKQIPFVKQRLYETADFPSCHAATVVANADRVLIAFFGGTRERAPDVCIYLCQSDGDHWTPPRKIVDGHGIPCWNPVLFAPTNDERLFLFFKIGASPATWTGMVMHSNDFGQTWSTPTELGAGLIGPVKNKPIVLQSGDWLAPSSSEGNGWHVHFERSSDRGRSWQRSEDVPQPAGMKCIQPSLLTARDGSLIAIGRTGTSGRMFMTRSDDQGHSWSTMRLIDLPNCNSGTDAQTLDDARHVVVYNHSATNKVRYPLNVAVSDDAVHWRAMAVLEDQGPEQYSYPSLHQGPDGVLHVAYTWKRRTIGYARLDLTDALGEPMPEGAWPGQAPLESGFFDGTTDVGG